MNQSSHTGQKNEKQADAAAVVLQWENVIFTPCTSYLTFTFRSTWIFFILLVFLFCTCAEPNKCDVDKCDVMQSRAVRIEPGKSKRRAWKSKECIRECKCWPHDNLRCLIFFCISFQLYSESTSLPVLNIVLWLKLYSFYEQVSKSDLTREPQTAHLVSLVNGNQTGSYTLEYSEHLIQNTSFIHSYKHLFSIDLKLILFLSCII